VGGGEGEDIEALHAAMAAGSPDTLTRKGRIAGGRPDRRRRSDTARAAPARAAATATILTGWT
jgi:hypothetical protein